MKTPDLSIDPQSIRQRADAKVYARGGKLVASGAVQSVRRRGDLLTAKVAGSGRASYDVSVFIKDGALEWAGCSCPYDHEGYCKHIVASALYANAHPEQVMVEQSVSELLAALSAPDLVRLVVDLVADSSELLARVQYYVRELAAGTLASPAQGLPPVDVLLIQTKVEAGLRAGLPSQEVIATDLNLALDLAYAGDAQQSMRILRILANCLIEQMDRSATKAARRDFRDYDRYSSWGDPYEEGIDLDEFAALAELDAVWAEACLALLLQDALSPDYLLTVVEEVEGLEEDVEAAIGELIDMGLYVSNHEEGEETFVLTGAALAEGSRTSSPQPLSVGAPDESDDFDESLEEIEEVDWQEDIQLSSVRLKVLARMERFDDYLKLAEEGSHYAELVQMLAHLGRAEEAETRALALAVTPRWALSLAQALQIEGLILSAMRVAERGLDAQVDQDKAALGRWLAGVAHQEGNIELAIKAAALTLLHVPSLGDYKTLRTVAGDSWPELRPDVLERLRHLEAGYGSDLCDIFLEEGLVPDAIKAAPTFLHTDLVKRLFPAAIPVDHNWVIKQSVARATPIMTEGKAPKYDEAVDWLCYVRDAYRAAGQPDIWADYLATIRAEHGRKYKLMGLLRNLD